MDDLHQLWQLAERVHGGESAVAKQAKEDWEEAKAKKLKAKPLHLQLKPTSKEQAVAKAEAAHKKALDGVSAATVYLEEAQAKKQ
eukprot:4366789-Prorocentrum_lima.AAC.1